MREPLCLPCALAIHHDEPIHEHDCVIRMDIPSAYTGEPVPTRCACECQDRTPETTPAPNRGEGAGQP